MIQQILIFLLLFSGFFSHGAVILKKRSRQALLHLEGLRTHQGAYFEVIDWEGNSRGLVQIKRLSKNKKKAIGVLKSGKMAKNWALEPVSRWVAMNKLKRSKQALLKRRHSTRRLAGVKRDGKWRTKRRIRQKSRRSPHRYLASATEGMKEIAPYKVEPYEAEPYREDPDEEKPQEEQYVIDNYSTSPNRDNSFNPAFLKKTSSDLGGNMNLVVGVSLAPAWSFMRLQHQDIRLFPMGIGFAGQAFTEGNLSDSMRWNIHAGYRQFSVSAQDSLCNRDECFLSINYITGGAELKFNFAEKKSFTLWGGLWGDMMFPLGYDNEINISDDEDPARIKDDSFDLLHGVLGFSLGVDVKVGRNLIVPLALEGHVIMPPTASVMAGAVGLRLGIGWKL